MVKVMKATSFSVETHNIHQVTSFASQKPSPTPSSIPPTERGSQAGMTLATVSIIFGIASMFIAGIPLGIAAVVVGVYAWMRGQRLAVIGVVIGVIGFVTALLLL
jgi:hypothetical protein